MKLQEALLCIDCENLYATTSSRCPYCGSRVSYPLSRALDRPATSVVPASQPPRDPSARARGGSPAFN